MICMQVMCVLHTVATALTYQSLSHLRGMEGSACLDERVETFNGVLDMQLLIGVLFSTQPTPFLLTAFWVTATVRLVLVKYRHPKYHAAAIASAGWSELLIVLPFMGVAVLQSARGVRGYSHHMHNWQKSHEEYGAKLVCRVTVYAELRIISRAVDPKSIPENDPLRAAYVTLLVCMRPEDESTAIHIIRMLAHLDADHAPNSE